MGGSAVHPVVQRNLFIGWKDEWRKLGVHDADGWKVFDAEIPFLLRRDEPTSHVLRVARVLYYAQTIPIPEHVLYFWVQSDMGWIRCVLTQHESEPTSKPQEDGGGSPIADRRDAPDTLQEGYEDPKMKSGFVELFRFHEESTRGGRSQGLAVGRWRKNSWGPWVDAAAKVTNMKENKIWMKREGGGRSREENLRFFQKQATDMPHVLKIWDVQSKPWQQTMVMCSHWYCGGTLLNVSQALTLSDKCRILLGAWKGLFWLNQIQKILHYDVKPNNIFVDLRRDGWMGALGDVDDVVLHKQCDEDHDYVGTNCYGAPIRHCDYRRDQVALLIATAEVITGISWIPFCNMAARESNWGWKTPYYTFTKPYEAYAKKIQATFEFAPQIPSVCRYLQALHSYRLHDEEDAERQLPEGTTVRRCCLLSTEIRGCPRGYYRRASKTRHFSILGTSGIVLMSADQAIAYHTHPRTNEWMRTKWRCTWSAGGSPPRGPWMPCGLCAPWPNASRTQR